MKKTLLFGLVFLFFKAVNAQQLPFFTQYREYHTLLNPAAVSMDYITKDFNMSFGASVRRQWIDIANNPQTQLLRGGYVVKGDAVSLNTGFHLIKDQTGPTGFTGIYGRLAGIVGNSDNGGFSAGFNAGLVQFKLKGSQIEFPDPTDALAQRDYNTLYPDIGLGIFGYRRINQMGNFGGDNVYAGFSIPQVFGLDLTFRERNKDFTIQRIPHFYALAGYYKHLNDDAYIETSVWLRHVKNVPFQADFNCRFQINSTLSMGAGYSTNKSLHAEFGVLMGENMGWDTHAFKIGYGFDLPFNTIAPHFGAAHEINLSVSLDNGR
jgi:type IX secretion system PorP/SprF family membrane protein